MKLRSRIHNMVVAGTLTLALVLTGIAGVTFAQETTAPTQPATTGITPATPDRPWFADAGKAGRTGSLVARIADILKMKVEDVVAARRAGKSFADIAKEKGVSGTELLDALVAQAKAQIDDLVSSGKITKDQADRALTAIRTNLEAALSRTEVGPQGAGTGVGRGPAMAGPRAMGGAFRHGARAGLARGYQRGWGQGFRFGFGMGLRMGQGPAGCPFYQQNQSQQNQNPGN